MRRGSLTLVWSEVAPKQRRHTQRTKEPAAHPGAIRRLRAIRRFEHKSISTKYLHRTEGFAVVLPVDVVEIRKMKTRTQRIALEEHCQPRGILVWQRLDQSSIHKAKDGHAGADAQC